jgi:hypothetical protein
MIDSPCSTRRASIQESNMPGDKDLDLLHGDARLQTDSLPERITRLRRELDRGAEIYSRDELDLLERKLADAEELYRVIQHP